MQQTPDVYGDNQSHVSEYTIYTYPHTGSIGMSTPEARDDYQEDRYERDRRNDREDDRQPIKRCMGVTALEGTSNLETGI